MIAFGPVPSRRLGKSLGINNIPPKVCTYSCTYCQVGRTNKLRTERQPFYELETILQDVTKKVNGAEKAHERIDVLTFVADGEPTLDINLGQEIRRLKEFGQVAVISNSSLIFRKDVQNDLMNADWVSLKVDSVDAHTWHKVNRPHPKLDLDTILAGILEFSQQYQGTLVTETMLIENVNDDPKRVEDTARFISQVGAKISYISVPIRPPAEAWVHPPDEQTITTAYQIFENNLEKTEYLIGYEGSAFARTGTIDENILSITSVHPMREDAVVQFLERAGADWSTIERLIDDRKLVTTTYRGNRFFMRRLS